MGAFRRFSLGLIGFPLGHSLSPRIHEAALQACGLAGTYELFPIPPEDQEGVQALFERLRQGSLDGVNVTIPYKQTVIPFVDVLTPTAQAIGAVNTIYVEAGQLIGENTDAPGFLADLQRWLALGPRPAGGGAAVGRSKTALVLGAGGSARAVVYALGQDGWQVTVAARRPEQGRALAESFAAYGVRTVEFEPLPEGPFDLIVNTTPLGMTPKVQECPLPEAYPLRPPTMVYDLVYNPRQTQLVNLAAARGVPAMGGLGMLIEQAALAFERWTGCRPPRRALWEAVGLLEEFC